MSAKYYEGLEKRLGFNPAEAVSFNIAGTTFDGRQDMLRSMKTHCSWDSSPPALLKTASDSDKKKFGDPFAIEVWAGTDRNNLTGEWSYAHIGYVPRGMCASCGASMTQKILEEGTCLKCGSQETLCPNEMLSKVDLSSIQVSIDNVVENQMGHKNLGCKVYVKVTS